MHVAKSFNPSAWRPPAALTIDLQVPAEARETHRTMNNHRDSSSNDSNDLDSNSSTPDPELATPDNNSADPVQHTSESATSRSEPDHTVHAHASEAAVHDEHSEQDELGMADHVPINDAYEDLPQQNRIGAILFEDDYEPPAKRIIEHWQLDEQLGSGAYGTVHRAFDKELSRTVAIKILHSRLRDEPIIRGRFLDEAQRMARVASRYVVDVYAQGVHKGDAYIVMQYYPTNLQNWQQDTTPAQILDAYRQAAAGLADLHRADLVHRDIKPANILVRPAKAGNDLQVVVGDLGLTGPHPPDDSPNRNTAGEAEPESAPAQRRAASPAISDDGDDASVAANRRRTRTGARLGTPAYMAPEQLRGQPATHRSDQFALCVSLYQALYHVHPFSAEADSDRELSYAARLQRITQGQLTPPRADAPGVTPRIHAALKRGLAADPNARFSDMNALIAALHVPPRKWWPYVVTALAVLSAALVAAFAYVNPPPSCEQSAEIKQSTLWSESEQARMQGRIDKLDTSAKRAWESLRTSFRTAVAVQHQARLALCHADAQPAPADNHIAQAAQQRQRRCLDERSEQLRSYRDQWITPDNTQNLPPLVIREYAATLLSLPTCEHLAQADFTEADADKVADIHDQLLTSLSQSVRGDYKPAAKSAKKALKQAKNLQDGPLIAEAKFRLGHALSMDSDIALASAHLLAAAKHATRHGKSYLAAEIWIYLTKHAAVESSNLADVYRYEQGAENALIALGVLDGNGHSTADTHPDISANPDIDADRSTANGMLLANYYEALGLRARLAGDHEEAIEHHQQAIEIWKAFEKNQIDLPALHSKSLNNLGIAYADADADMTSLAIETYSQALKIRQDEFGPEHDLVGDVHLNLGRLYLNLGSLAKAREHLTAALEIASRDNTQPSAKLHELTAMGALENYAYQLAEHNEPQMAVHLAALKRYADEIASIHSKLADHEKREFDRGQELLVIAGPHEYEGRLPQALAIINDALAIYEDRELPIARASCSDTSLDYATTLASAATILCKQQRFESARDHTRRSFFHYTRCATPEDANGFRDQVLSQYLKHDECKPREYTYSDPNVISTPVDAADLGSAYPPIE
ncbi:MAG: hypothetical protein Tsb0020_19910 [Haliangiales bacterium]